MSSPVPIMPGSYVSDEEPYVERAESLVDKNGIIQREQERIRGHEMASRCAIACHFYDVYSPYRYKPGKEPPEEFLDKDIGLERDGWIRMVANDHECYKMGRMAAELEGWFYQLSVHLRPHNIEKTNDKNATPFLRYMLYRVKNPDQFN